MSGSLPAPRIRLPRSVRAGEAFEVRTLMEHPMETGIRQDGSPTGRRDMLTRLTLRVNGQVAMQAEYRNGTSANPYHVFFLKLDRTSELDFAWTDEQGRVARATARVAVS
jgi:sulfur-oxidizing protein SoxZ